MAFLDILQRFLNSAWSKNQFSMVYNGGSLVLSNGSVHKARHTLDIGLRLACSVLGPSGNSLVNRCLCPS